MKVYTNYILLLVTYDIILNTFAAMMKKYFEIRCRNNHQKIMYF